MMLDSAQEKKIAVIIGAGPAGLTAALELLRRTDIKPIVLEKSTQVGGISKTVRFGENKMDLGGHRFFSKSDRVINWWLDILPLSQDGKNEVFEIQYQNQKKQVVPTTTSNQDDVMLVRSRKSRIFFEGKFYDYPITLSFATFRNLGFIRIVKIGVTYVYSVLFPRKEEKTLEDFLINRFGNELYLTFFKTYTEKVWGMPCNEIGANWGRQRIKGLSVWGAITDSVRKLLGRKNKDQKKTETSLIEYFMYPKYGPGHLWEVAAQKTVEEGGEIITGAEVITLHNNGVEMTAVTYLDSKSGKEITIDADYVFSTMPINELFKSFTHTVSSEVSDIALGLQFRDFIIIGILLTDDKLAKLTDNWIYIHDKDVQVGRIQFFHNWSPHMVQTKDSYLIGLEYFCTEGDEFWNLSETEMKALALRELQKIGIASDAVTDMYIVKVPKAYPSYTGVYESFPVVQAYLDSIQNLFPIGRNGMHRYNNQDHSMLTAMASVEVILGIYKKEDIWHINAEADYHEEK